MNSLKPICLIGWVTKINFIDSAFCSAKGLLKAVSEERTIKIQIAISFVLILIGILLDISKVYLITIIVVCFLVIILELFNRSFEMLVDFISPKYNKRAGEIKDAIAGVVLTTFILAMIVSIMILAQPLLKLLNLISNHPNLILLIVGNILLISMIILIFYLKNYSKTIRASTTKEF